MTVGIVLLVICVGALVILWAGFKGVEIGGPLTVGIISVVIGVLGLCHFQDFNILGQPRLPYNRRGHILLGDTQEGVDERIQRGDMRCHSADCWCLRDSLYFLT